MQASRLSLRSYRQPHIESQFRCGSIISCPTHRAHRALSTRRTKQQWTIVSNRPSKQFCAAKRRKRATAKPRRRRWSKPSPTSSIRKAEAAMKTHAANPHDLLVALNAFQADLRRTNTALGSNLPHKRRVELESEKTWLTAEIARARSRIRDGRDRVLHRTHRRRAQAPEDCRGAPRSSDSHH